MSLLIKALDKAQAEKAHTKKSADKKQVDKLTSEKRNHSDGVQKRIKATETAKKPSSAETVKGSAANISQNTVKADVAEVKTTPVQAQAANVFTAKHSEPSYQIAKLALIVGLIVLAVMGAIAYWYQTVINVPDIVIPPKPAFNQEMPQPLPQLAAVNEVLVLDDSETVEPEMMIDTSDSVVIPEQKVKKKEVKAVPVELSVETVFAASEPVADVEETLAVNETVIDTDVTSVKVARLKTDLSGLGIASKSASIKATHTKPTSGINPILMRAYEAYKAGNDYQAREDYKQVLQRYGLNVDAMLGLGAIAARQGRVADANGWYRKILEVEPRNEMANAGLLSIQQNTQPQHRESHIKSMLATTPKDANLHAALGNVYAGQGKWPNAQQAYFDAYQYNPSADNAFNLAVGLDQLGKPKLALPYYQEALQKANQSNVIDTVALEARISSIQ